MGEQVSKDQIESLESVIGFNLPETYKSFLEENKEGYGDGNYNFRTDDGSDESDVRRFYGFDEDSNNVLDKYQLFSDRLKSTELAIAYDSLGNHIILNESAEVLFFYHESESYVLISKSFSDFLQGLFIPEEEEIESVFDAALKSENIAYFQQEIKKLGDVNKIFDEYGRSIISVASLFNKLKLVKFLVDEGADLRGALLNACDNGNLEVVRYLINAGADLNERDLDSNNDTPFMKACMGGHMESVKLLVESGVDIHLKDLHGNTAQKKAKWFNKEEFLNYLETEVYTS